MTRNDLKIDVYPTDQNEDKLGTRIRIAKIGNE